MNYSTVLIHLLVILFVFSRGDVVHPVLVVEIPAHGLLDPFLKLEARLPAEFRLEFAAVDGVAHVVAEAVGDVGDQFLGRAFRIAEQTVYCLDDYLDEINVLNLSRAV